MVRSQKTLTLPNLISMLRLVSAPVAFYYAAAGNAGVYRILFLAAVVTDFLDGVVARLTHQQTEFGARLDTIADIATYLTLLFAVYRLWPGLLHDVSALIIAAVFIYGVGFGYGLIKFRKITAYHSWGGKLSAVLVPVTLILWFLSGYLPPFQIALSIAILSGIDEILITWLLPGWNSNIRSSWHAWKGRQNLSL